MKIIFQHAHVLSFISFMSAPAGWLCLLVRFNGLNYPHAPANALSLPVRTNAPISLSASSSATASFNSSKRGVLRAFRALGRLSVMSPTPWAGRDTRMYSYSLVAVDMARRYNLLVNGECAAFKGVLVAVRSDDRRNWKDITLTPR